MAVQMIRSLGVLGLLLVGVVVPLSSDGSEPKGDRSRWRAFEQVSKFDDTPFTLLGSALRGHSWGRGRFSDCDATKAVRSLISF